LGSRLATSAYKIFGKVTALKPISWLHQIRWSRPRKTTKLQQSIFISIPPLETPSGTGQSLKNCLQNNAISPPVRSSLVSLLPGHYSRYSSDWQLTGTLPSVTGTLPSVTGTLPSVTGTLPSVTGTLPSVTGTLPSVR